MSRETLIGFIIARLVSKIIEYAQKYGHVIIMDRGLYDGIVSGPPHPLLLVLDFSGG